MGQKRGARGGQRGTAMGWAEGAGNGEECEWGHEVWRGIQFQAVSVSSVNASQRGSVQRERVFSGVRVRAGGKTSVPSFQHGAGRRRRKAPKPAQLALQAGSAAAGRCQVLSACACLGPSRGGVSTAARQLVERSRPFLVRRGWLAALLPRVSALLLQPPLHPLPKVQCAALVCSGVGAREGQSLFDAS